MWVGVHSGEFVCSLEDKIFKKEIKKDNFVLAY